MKKQLVLKLSIVTMILFAIQAKAQRSDFLTRTTLEAGLGYHYPTSPSYGLNTSDLESGSDMMANVQMGLIPKYKITEQWSLQVDATYIVNFSQDHGYQGGVAQLDGKGTTGRYFTANLGVAYKLN